MESPSVGQTIPGHSEQTRNAQDDADGSENLFPRNFQVMQTSVGRRHHQAKNRNAGARNRQDNADGRKPDADRGENSECTLGRTN